MREEVNGRVSKVARRPTPSMQPSWSKLETLQRDTSKVSARPNSILHSSRPTTTSNCRRRSADIAGDPAPLTSLPASELELTSRSREEVPVGVGDPGARRPRRRGGGHVERGPPWCGQSRNGGGLCLADGRRPRSEFVGGVRRQCRYAAPSRGSQRSRGRHCSSTAIRSAVSSPPETAGSSKQPPQAEIKAAAGSSRSRGGGPSSRPRSNCIDDDDDDVGDDVMVACVMLQWQLCWLTSTTEQA